MKNKNKRYIQILLYGKLKWFLRTILLYNKYIIRAIATYTRMLNGPIKYDPKSIDDMMNNIKINILQLTLPLIEAPLIIL